MDEMESLMKEMLNLKKWAVVGATENQDKFGYKIYKLLKDKGYDVTPVNPVYETIDGDMCLNSLKDMEEFPECVSVVVSPKRALSAVKDAIDMGIKRMWFQPGAFDEEVISLAEDNGIKIVFYNCVLVELNKL